jgi:hypothetical protein
LNASTAVPKYRPDEAASAPRLLAAEAERAMRIGQWYGSLLRGYRVVGIFGFSCACIG